jgi:ketosteroid isomerase-like protein
MISTDDALRRARDYFETLSLETAQGLDVLYTDDAWFKDPFNEVQGVPAIRHIFVHMFSQVDAPRFVVLEAVAQDGQAFITWEFRFRMRRWRKGEQCIRGCSQLHFAADGRICRHRDWWDAAEELYEKLPVLGSLMRGLKALARS